MDPFITSSGSEILTRRGGSAAIVIETIHDAAIPSYVLVKREPSRLAEISQL
jgi:hypothetical protein